MPEANNEFWDDASENYTFDDTGPWIVLDRSKYDHLRRYLASRGVEPKRVLEVGCGSATMATFFAKDGSESHALDVSAGALRAARQRMQHNKTSGPIIRGSGFQLPYKDGAFDVVMSNGLLEHFEDMTPVVAEMVRVLRPGGVSFQDICPRKFSIGWLLDNALLAAGWGINKARGQDHVALHLKQRLRYNLSFFRENPHASEAAVGGYEARLDEPRIRTVMDRVGLHEVTIRGSGVVPHGLVNQPFLARRSYWGLYPLIHRADNTRWATAVGNAFWAFGVKPAA